ncbi:EamA family transporter [Agromyces aerolatus]|uniref:EamA family transporter n=1 Tax=Agromyces sp. LY-1074 TaxID=3074080 RepID=UPI002856303F|nr:MULTISPECIES: EamA family transporter [unclassified Agromyces]MDR5701066.1 EamA family transporter [Agromyces sp. LY-1074]MDR5707706.1 EamA family transporter [Agromyces sp. LY-1358]
MGITIGLASGLAFGAGGAVVKPLLEAGWTPGAAVFARISVAAVLLALPALWALRFDLRPLWRARWTVLGYALLAIICTQVAFYASIATIPVSTALLIEYLAPVALVLVAWARRRRPPQLVVIAGSLLAVTGLVLVIGPGGGALDPAGILFAVLAMVGVCAYFVLSDRADASLPPIALAGAGVVVGALALGLLGVTGLLPFAAVFTDVAFFGTTAPWWIPVLTVGVISTAFAYVSGITAIRMLGSRLASFLGLSEVVFAALVAWVVLGEAIGPVQVLGGLAILGGIVLVRLERPASDPVARALDIDVVPVPPTEAPRP